MSANLENPIILVKPRPQDHQQRIIGGFGEPKEIVELTPQFRKQLSSRIKNISESFSQKFQEYPDIPAVISLKLHPDAMAKSHRPMLLLERVGMLPIGTRRFGELLLPATQASLSYLSDVIDKNEAKAIRANISTISSIDVFNTEDVLLPNIRSGNFKVTIALLEKWINEKKPLVIERFTNTSDKIDNAIASEFYSLLEKLGIEIKHLKLRSSGGAKHIVNVNSIEIALKIASFPGTRSLLTIDEFLPIEARPQMFAAIGEAPAGVLVDPTDDLPIVGVVDTGVPAKDVSLKKWIVSHSTYIIPPDTDNLHGTFVAGIIAGVHVLNGHNPIFPNVQARVLDLAALATTSPGTSFDEMFERINETVLQHPEVKIWNCSFGSKSPGDPDNFGMLAQELDKLSDQLDILFIIAAGNYETPPLRSWPPLIDLAGMDRISQPSESVRSLTIGSIAHSDSLVNAGEPSPFSRRGPGPAKTPKPDLIHRGGNCDHVGNFGGAGIRSLLPGGHIGESIGTSFSTPIVSAIAANVWQALLDKKLFPNKEMVKALLTHSAAVASPKRSAEDRDYYGFGIPESVIDTFFCDPESFTMMFQAELMDGIIWEKTPFPIPACLHKDGTHLRAEVVMTLVYSPPVDAKHGSEYIRANIDASFGNYDPDEDGALHHHGLVPLDVPRKEDLYEKAMIDHGFKWSPVKVYKGRFPGGKAGKSFRLKLELLRRAGEPSQIEPQKAVVLLTFKAIDAGQNVYADGIRAMRIVNWVTETVSNKTHVRV